MLSHREWHYLGRIGRWDLVGVHMALLEEVYHWGWTLRFQKSTSGSVLLSQPEDQDEAHSYCSRAGMLSTAIIMDQTSKTI